MISLNKIVDVIEGLAPFTYTWETDDPCITFSTPSGTTTKRITTTITGEDATCLDSATITLHVTSSCGNTESFNIPIASPCASFTAFPITASSEFTFVSSAVANGCANLNFVWDYDNFVFDLVSQTDSAYNSTLTLSLRTGANLPNTTPVSVTITDCNGCSQEVVYNKSFCTPQAAPLVVPMYYTQGITAGYLSADITFPNPSGCSSSIDWSTLSISLPTGITATSLGNNKRYFASGILTGPLTGTYTVKNSLGVTSTPGTITFIFNEPTGQGIVIPNYTLNLECTNVPGDVVEILLEDKIILTGTATVDWDTWQLVQPPNPNGSIVLATRSDGKQVLRYTVPSPVAADVFSWTVKDSNGIPANSTIYTIVDCVQAPTATNDTAEVACGASVEIDVLSNDLGNGSLLNPSSVIITESPVGGTASVTPMGKINYVAPTGFNGVVTLKYKVKNTSGQFSNEATVTITVVCSGVNANVTLCN